MNRCLTDLVHLLDLEPLEVNLFRGQSRDLGGRSVYGGQVISQALVAATRSVDGGLLPHSLHAYFLRPGDMDAPIVYSVDRVRDGRSFTTRNISAIQHGQTILSMMASFNREEAGFEHQIAMPDVPPPEALTPMPVLRAKWLADELARNPALPERIQHMFTREHAFEFAWINPPDPFQPDVRPPTQGIWFRAAGKLPDDPMLHRCVLAYASDFNLASTALLPHAKSWFSPDMIVASIDHALWFHRDMRVDDWLFYAMDTPSAQSVRGMTRGLIFDRQGRLVASSTQECLMRPIKPA